MSVLILWGHSTDKQGAISKKEFIGPDGTENHLVSCYATKVCYENARKVCNGNYKIVNTNTETSGMNGDTSSVIKLLIKCEK